MSLTLFARKYVPGLALLLVCLTLLLPAALPALTLFNTSLIEREGEGTPKADFFRLQTIVIDAGHGGKDPGGIGSSHQEKDIVLSIAKYLAASIRQQFPDIQVVLTREDDTFVPLHERAAIANRHHADLFISIHANIMPNSGATAGTETYVMGQHVADHNLQVAKRENAAILLESDYQQNYDYDPNSDEGHILMAMYQSAFLEQSILFAELVEAHFAQTALRKSRGVKQAGFVVLKESSMPSVLIEAGFLSNSQEEKYLASEQGQQQMAQAIFEAFRTYKHKVEGEEVSVAAIPSKQASGIVASPIVSSPIASSPTNSSPTAAPGSSKAVNAAPKLIGSPLPASPIGTNPRGSSLEGSIGQVESPALQPQQLQFQVPESSPAGPGVVGAAIDKQLIGAQVKGAGASPTEVPQQTQGAIPYSSPAMVVPVVYQSVNTARQPEPPGAAEIRMPVATTPSLIPSSNLVFAVQLAAASKEIDTKQPRWQAIPYPLAVMQEGGLYKYQARGMSNAQQAREAKQQLEKAGFAGAFIVIYRAEKKLSVEETRQILRQ